MTFVTFSAYKIKNQMKTFKPDQNRKLERLLRYFDIKCVILDEKYQTNSKGQ